MYLNFYLEGVAGILGTLLSLALYMPVRMFWAFIISITLTFLGILCLLLFQENYASSFWIKPFLIESVRECPYPDQEGKECNNYYLGYVVPTVVFIAKVGVNMSFLNVYQASFGQNIIFPFYKRATAIGICNLIARGITIAAPMVAEAPKPYPACIMLLFSIFQLIDVLFLPTYS